MGSTFPRYRYMQISIHAVKKQGSAHLELCQLVDGLHHLHLDESVLLGVAALPRGSVMVSTGLPIFWGVDGIPTGSQGYLKHAWCKTRLDK